MDELREFMRREARILTGVPEFDHVLGGGVRAGDVVLLRGNP